MKIFLLYSLVKIFLCLVISMNLNKRLPTGTENCRFCWVSFSSGLTLPGEGKRGRREGEGKRERGRERETERESTQPPRRRSAGTARRISVPVRRVPASGCLPAPPKCLPSAGSRPPSPLPGSLPSS